MNSTQTPGDATTILNTVQKASVRLDGRFRFMFINRMAEILLGALRSEMIGKTRCGVRRDIAGTPLEEGKPLSLPPIPFLAEAAYFVL